MSGKKVLLIGWDAADWKVARPLMDAGRMPNLRRLVESGCSSDMATLQPSYSPMLWPSIATGVRPFRHGVHGFMEPRHDGRGVQRVTNLSWKSKAVWNILNQSGMRSIVVGWWPSFPAQPIDGVMVSDSFHRVRTDFRALPGMVHPESWGEPLAALRINPEDLRLDALEAFVPLARALDQNEDQRLLAVARVICECVNIHRAATRLMDKETWDLCAVYFDAIDHFGHTAMKYHPPRQSCIGERDFESYHNVVQAGYELHDRMLGTLLAKAGDDTRVVLLSDHGFHSDHLRPALIPQVHAGPAGEHRNNGVFVMAGPGVRRNVRLPGTSLLDVAPTVLALFGLPAGEDMEGRVLSEAFEAPPASARIPSWETVEGRDGRHAPHLEFDPMAATDTLEQLVALGYVEEPDADASSSVKRTLTELRTNLAESYQDAGRHAEAFAILNELRAAEPDDLRVAVRFFASALALRRREELAELTKDWCGRRREVYENALRRANELRRIARSRAEQPGRDPSVRLLDDAERNELRQVRRLARYDASLTRYFEAQLFYSSRRWQDALRCVESIPAEDLIRPALFNDRAELLMRLGRWDDAEAILAEGLKTDPDDARTHFECARLALHKRDFAGAADSALNGLALLVRDARGHYLLGVALCGLERFEDAAEAFRRALNLNPRFPVAYLWMARIYRRHIGDPDQAKANSQQYLALIAGGQAAAEKPRPTPVAAVKPVAFAASARQLPPLTDEVVIVTGLPRSGTSMLMQMLVAGGLLALTDGQREADEDNPRGYFEFEPVKQMAKNTEWFSDARGKVIKIVAPMIPHVPEGVPCRVILIERDFDEILASQQKMIQRRSGALEQPDDRKRRLKQEYLKTIVWTKGFLSRRPDTRLLCANRDAILRDPNAAAAAINSFLGGILNAELTAAAVRPELNRNRSVTSNTEKVNTI